MINKEWITPENPVEDKVLLYIHGGGVSPVSV